MPTFQDEKDRCSFTWNPGEWPYITRCVLAPHNYPKHVDHKQRSCGPKTRFDIGEELQAVIEVLTNPDNRGPSLHRDKLRTLAMEWPILAAVLGALLQRAHGEVPSSLRRAMKAVSDQ